MSRSRLSGRSSTRAYLGLGGNLGDPRHAMSLALKAVDGDPSSRVAVVSSLYRTPPWGKLDQPDFLNAVAAVDTTLPARALLDLCLATEHALKRRRAERWGPRAIDIDVLIFGDQRIAEEGLEVPHPRMLDRAFVLVPLAEIAPDLTLAGKSAAQRARLLDATGIEVMPGGRDWWREG